MHRILKTTTKLQKIININKLKLKIMNTIYQIVVKGNVTNKVDILEAYTFQDYKRILTNIKKSILLHILYIGTYDKAN